MQKKQNLNLDNANSAICLQQQCGKIELSLVNFALMNPTWNPPREGADFIQNLKEKVKFVIKLFKKCLGY